MKKVFKRALASLLVAVMLLSVAPVMANAGGWSPSKKYLSESGSCGSNAYYTFDKETGKLIISGTGKIDDDSFARSDIRSVIIENGITEICSGAFAYCENMTSITISNSVTIIDENAFYGCTGLTSITIPDSVTIIEWNAFYGCTGLTSITIPDSVTFIARNAFSGCTGLTSIKVDKGNDKYDSRNNCNAIIETETNTLFQGCKKTVIPNSVTSIADAFYDCTGLTSITIPDSVTSIEWNAFYGCTGLTSITIPDSVTFIAGNAFSGCTGLTSIKVDKGNDKYDSRNNCNAIIETETNTLIHGCKNTIIPNGVTNIGSRAFSNCTGLTSITIPDSVTSIGYDAFEYCTGLTSITIGSGVTSIGGSAFSGCTGLTSITIPDSVTSIDYDAFYDTGYYNDESNWENNVLYIGKHLIDAKAAISGEYEIKKGTKTIAGYAFSDCTGLTSITIPDSVTSIGEYAFSWCTGLTSITIPDSVTSIDYDAFYDTGYYNDETNWENDVLYIGNHLIEAKDAISGEYEIKKGTKTIAHSAFENCSGLTSITIPDSVTSIGDEAFDDCSGLTSITIPDSVTSIGYGAFENCTGLTSITIGSGVTSIGGSAFYGCGNLRNVFYSGTEEQWKEIFVGNNNSNLTWGTIHYNIPAEEAPTHCAFEVIEPTCTEWGYIHMTCDCGYDTKYSYGNALGHGNLEFVRKVEPSCEYSGYSIYWCDRCGDYIENDFVDSLGHNKDTFIKKVEQTYCVNGGYSVYHCNRCDCDFTDDYVGYGHSKDYVVRTVEPTCTMSGYTVYHCNKCGINFSDFINFYNGHSKDSVIETVEPTCTENGYTVYHCNKCGEDFKGDYVYNDHSKDSVVEMVAPTCDEHGYTIYHCNTCGENFEDDYVSGYGHGKVRVVEKVEPTCDEMGYTVYHCDTCGENFEDNYVWGGGHTKGEFVKKVEPTCTEYGYNIYRCSTCGEEFESGSYFSTGHSFVGDKCTNCGYEIATKEISLNNPITVETKSGAESFYAARIDYFKFVPKASGTYYFNAKGSVSGSLDCSLYDSNMNVIDYGHTMRGGVGKPFNFGYDFEAGKTYYFSVLSFGHDDYLTAWISDDADFSPEIPDEPVENPALTDEKTGIKIEYNKEFDEGTQLEVKEIFWDSSFQLIENEYGKGSKMKIYDIVPTKDGKKVQPNGEVTVRIPVPTGFNSSKISVVYVDPDSGKATKIPCEVKDGYVEFKTNHFSQYAIVEVVGGVESVSIADVTMDYKSSKTLNPEITADEGAEYTVSYSSDSKNVTVDENGKIYAAKKGTANITVTVTDSNGNTVTDTCKVTVEYSFWQWIIVIVLFGWIWY